MATATSRTLTAAAVVLTVALTAPVSPATGNPSTGNPSTGSPATGSPAAVATTQAGERSFVHVATFDVTDNGSQVAEIVAATGDGQALVYTDSEKEAIGFVDITDPAAPVADGTLDMPGEPTSVAVDGPTALVAVNTSASFDDPSGQLVVVDVGTRTVVATHALPGQPDSVAVSPAGPYAAVVIENERDEDLHDGLIPQLPSGSLVVVGTDGAPADWTLTDVDLTGLADIAPGDAEPEFVDINGQDQAVVSLQENNHLIVVDLPTATVAADFPAGEVTLSGVDATEEELGPQGNGLIKLDETITRRREPDAVAWVDDDIFATANEGDYTDAAGVQGGSRGWSLYNVDGTLEADAGTAFEYAAIRAGHYPEHRSANKGTEPESVEVGRYDGATLMFVGSERANVVEVLDVTTGQPSLRQLLPTGIGPEGLLAIEARDLLVAGTETSVEGVPAMITIYDRQDGPAPYPQLSSIDTAGTPVPWVAQSGLAGDLDDPNRLWSVSDSILADGYVYPIEVTSATATILDRHKVTGASFNLDLEGIADAPEGGFWLASEGRDQARPNALVKVDDTFAVTDEVQLPAALAAQATNSGFEGVAVEPTENGTATRYLYAVVQREWADDGDGVVKIGRYDLTDDTWTFAAYRKDDVASPNGGWVGLSELTRLPDGTFAVIERDNQLGPAARIKKLYRVDLASADFRPYGQPLANVDKVELADLLDPLAANSVWTPDKLEGLGVTTDGRAYVVTDNDGLDDAIGQTVFLQLDGLDVGTAEPDPVCPAGGDGVTFSDVVSGGTFAADIACVVEAGIAEGTSATTYTPARDVTRAEMARFIFNLIETRAPGTLDPAAPNPFTDVTDGGLFEDAISALAAAGVLQGTSAATYAPAAAVTRGQMARFIANALDAISGHSLIDADNPDDATNGNDDVDVFADVDGDDVFAAAINALAAEGVVEGDGTNYDGAGNVTRAQMAAFIVRAARA